VKFTPKGYFAHTLRSLRDVIYITLHDITKSIIAVVKPHAAITNGKDSIPAPIVVPIINKIEPIDLEFIADYFYKVDNR
jgi:hypothetical protein